MARSATWALGVGVSVLLHVAVLGGAAVFFETRPLPQQTPPPTELELASETVRRSRASAETAEAQPIPGQEAVATPLAQDAPRRTTAAALLPEVATPASLEPVGAVTTAEPPAPAPLAESATTGRATATHPPDARPAAAVSLPVSEAQSVTAAPQATARAQEPEGQKAEAAVPEAAALVDLAVEPAAVPDVPLGATSVATVAARSDPTPPQPPDATQPETIVPASRPLDGVAAQPAAASRRPATARPAQAVQAAPRSSSILVARAEIAARIEPTATAIRSDPETASQPAIVPASLPRMDPAATLALPAGRRPAAPPLDARPGREALPDPLPLDDSPASDSAARLTAALAWAVGDIGVADPVSLAAIQAFMQPGDPSGDAAGSPVRDGLEALLSGVPCARLQTEFVAETGVLELRGHVPEDGLRAPLLSALQAQIGTDIRVADEMRILPRPQCGALAGIANIGLPQSDDQRTNPRIVGPNAHVRAFDYREGDRLRLDLTAPDYDSYVYVDYFDADGNVLHLQPNEIVPLEETPAKAVLTSGVERSGKPALRLTIGPPYGQEIAAAFAASEPLYDGVRPLVEPAEPYLAFLAERVAALRAENPEFKGEWVYFFISTAPSE